MTRSIVLVALQIMLAGCTGTTIYPRDDAPTKSEAFLLPEPYADLEVEIYFAPTFRPSATALAALRTTLENVTDKRDIRILDPRPLSDWAAEAGAWQRTHLEALALQYSQRRLDLTEFGRSDTAVIHVYYLRGHYDTEDGPSYGVESRGRAFLFDSSGFRASDVDRERFERHTLIHEVGHALGLVNCDLPMVTPRENHASRCHSTKDESVMHDAIHVSASSLFTDNVIVYRFDQYDLEDLAAFREAGARPSAATPDIAPSLVIERR